MFLINSSKTANWPYNSGPESIPVFFVLEMRLVFARQALSVRSAASFAAALDTGDFNGNHLAFTTHRSSESARLRDLWRVMRTLAALRHFAQLGEHQSLLLTSAAMNQHVFYRT
jgi:hypothetical protein